MRKKAFTIIEMIIAISLGMLIIGMFMGVTIFYQKHTFIKLRQAELIQTNNFVLNRIIKDVQMANYIYPISTAQQLKLKIQNDDISYELANGKVRRSQNLSSSYLTVKNEINLLEFEYLGPKFIKIYYGPAQAPQAIIIALRGA